jgi:catechol 2,3-dioxygenase-like lactoylglutathione lyase family enzyme
MSAIRSNGVFVRWATKRLHRRSRYYGGGGERSCGVEGRALLCHEAFMDINGVAHLQLTVGNFDACQTFYEKLLTFFGMTPVMRADGFFYCVGGRTGVAISRADESHVGERFVQRRVGLHHVCFRARERADVDAVHAFLLDVGAKIVHPPEDGPWAPGYYSVLFEDPDGIRLEVNHVPGKGLLSPDASSRRSRDPTGERP